MIFNTFEIDFLKIFMINIFQIHLSKMIIYKSIYKCGKCMCKGNHSLTKIILTVTLVTCTTILHYNIFEEKL